jgi:predicted secreted protein
MSVTFGIAIYLVLWWTVLFAVLPIGVRTQSEDGSVVPGTPESAPTAPRLIRVVVLTTLISAAVRNPPSRRPCLRTRLTRVAPTRHRPADEVCTN